MSNDEYERDDPGPDWRERAASAERGERERELRREHGDDVVRDVRDRDDVRSEANGDTRQGRRRTGRV